MDGIAKRKTKVSYIIRERKSNFCDGTDKAKIMCL